MTISATTLRPSFAEAQAHYEAFTAHATANGVTGEAWDAMFALCHTADFLQWAADLMADGCALEDPKVCERVKWAAWKLAELPFQTDDALPTHRPADPQIGEAGDAATDAEQSSTGNAGLDDLLEDTAVRENDILSTARAVGVGQEAEEALTTLLDAAGLLDLLSRGIAGGLALDGSETALAFQMTVMKLIEFNGMLPEHLRGDLDFKCFKRTGAARAVAKERRAVVVAQASDAEPEGTKH